MKSKIISALIVFAGICLPGCKDSFLERTPENSYTDENFYASDDALDAATAPLYNKAWFDYNSRSIMFLGSTRANDFYSPYAFPEFTTFQVTALSEDLAKAWKSFYSVITLANQAIDDINNKCTVDVSESAKKRAISEARLMRACAYFYMLRAWGPVIIIEHNQDVVDNPLRPLNREEDVFQFIINDLTYAAENLPEMGSQSGRATRWAAEGMLAKVYLARSGWKKGDNAMKVIWNLPDNMQRTFATTVGLNCSLIMKTCSNTGSTTTKSHCSPCNGYRWENGEYKIL